jgi:hypothetical protein
VSSVVAVLFPAFSATLLLQGYGGYVDRSVATKWQCVIILLVASGKPMVMAMVVVATFLWLWVWDFGAAPG